MLEEFNRWLTTLGYSKQRTRQYPRAVERLLEWTDKTVSELTQQDLTDYVSDLKTRKNSSLKPSYINNQITAIRTFAKFLYRTSGFNLPTGHLLYCKVEQSLPNFLTEEEVQMIYKVTTNTKYGYRDRAMLALCYGAGLRRSEAIKMHVKDIDLRRGYVHVRHGKNYMERIVPIPPKAMQDIRDYLKHARPMFKKGRTHQRELFLSYRGNVPTCQVFEKRIRELIEQTGNKALIAKRPTLHTLRHSIATHLLNRGVPLDQVSKFLGHSSLDSTQVYTHIYEKNIQNLPP